MRTLSVLTAGVCLVFGLQAMDIPAEGRAAEWVSHQKAARAAMQQHDYSAAAGLFDECLAFSTTPAERAMTLASYGIALNRADRNVEAKAALEQAIAAWADAPADARGVASGVLAAVDRSLGDYQSSESVLRAAMADASVSSGTRATLMVNLADLLREQVRDTEANAVLDEASRLTGLSHEQHISVLVETAELTRDLRMWNESVALWNQVGSLAAGEKSVDLEAVYTGGLGETWFAAGNMTRAEPLLRRSLDLLRKEPGATASQLATALSLMARVYIEEDKLVLAQDALDEAIKDDEKSLGAGHPQVAMLLELRAVIQSRRGETQAAREDLGRARGIMTSHFGPESSAVASICATLGEVEQRANRPAAAVVDYQTAMDMLRKTGVNTLRFTSGIVAQYAAALKALHKPEEARALLQSFAAAQTHATAAASMASAVAAARSFQEQ